MSLMCLERMFLSETARLLKEGQFAKLNSKKLRTFVSEIELNAPERSYELDELRDAVTHTL